MKKSDIHEFKRLPITELLNLIQEITTINELVKAKMDEHGYELEDLEIMSKLIHRQ